MPRDELNNPTERIGRLLDEQEEWIAWAKWTEQQAQKLVPEFFSKLPPLPSDKEYSLEMKHRKDNLRKTIKKRGRMQHLRDFGFKQRGVREFNPEADKDFLDGPPRLTKEQIEAIERELEKGQE